jgi:hypothetical protein
MQDVKYKRELGNGRWDRKLKENMVALSKADNYDDAKREWIATGEVWWRGLEYHNLVGSVTKVIVCVVTISCIIMRYTTLRQTQGWLLALTTSTHT